MGLLRGYLADRINQKRLPIVSLAILGVVGYGLFNVATTPFWQSALSFLEGAMQSGFFYINSYSMMQRSADRISPGRCSSAKSTARSGFVQAVCTFAGCSSSYSLRVSGLVETLTQSWANFDASSSIR